MTNWAMKCIIARILTNWVRNNPNLNESRYTMALDFEPLDLNEIKKEAKRMSSENSYSNDEYYAKYVRLPERDGFVLMRFLPRKKGQKLYCVTRIHTLNNPTTNQKRIFHCPKNEVDTDKGKQWRGDCIICKYYSDLWQKSDGLSGKEQEDMRNDARALKPIERYYYNVIVRSEIDPKTKTTGTNVGPKIYSCGKQIHAKIVRAINGDEDAGEKALGDITHPNNGRDFRLVKKVVKSGNREYPNYDFSKFEDVSAAGTMEELEKWLSSLHDLQALRILKTPEELKHALRVHCGMIVEGEQDNSLDEFRQARGESRPSENISRSNVISPSSLAADSVNEEVLSSKKASKSVASEETESLADDEFLKELDGL